MNRPLLDLLGFKRCENVLRDVEVWQHVYAMVVPARSQGRRARHARCAQACSAALFP